MNRAERRRKAREEKRSSAPGEHSMPKQNGAGMKPDLGGMLLGSFSTGFLPTVSEDPGLCSHMWAEAQSITFSCGTQGELKECTRCGGFVQPCRSCGQYHLVDSGRGGEATMPRVVSRPWLEAHRCDTEDFGEVPVPVVRMPPDFEADFDTFATYWEIENRPGFYELESFSF